MPFVGDDCLGGAYTDKPFASCEVADVTQVVRRLGKWPVVDAGSALDVARSVHRPERGSYMFSGVYVVHSGGYEPLYVGESWDVGRRLHDHFLSYPLPKQLAAFALRLRHEFARAYVIECGDARHDVEAALIRQLRPRLNMEGVALATRSEGWRYALEDLLEAASNTYPDSLWRTGVATARRTLELLGSIRSPAAHSGGWPRCWCEAMNRKLVLSDEDIAEAKRLDDQDEAEWHAKRERGEV